MRRKTYLKAKNVQTFADVLRVTAWNSFFTLKRKLEFTDNFSSHFIGRGLASRLDFRRSLVSGVPSPGKERGLLSRTAAIAQIKIFHSQSLRHKASMLMNPTPVFLPYLYATICGPRVVTLSLCPSRVTRKKNGRVSSPGFYAAISPRGFLQSRSTNKPKEARKRHHSQWPKPKLFVWTLPFIKFPILFVCKQSRTKL